MRLIIGLVLATTLTTVPKGFLIYEQRTRPAPVISVDGPAKWRAAAKDRGLLWANPCGTPGLGAAGRLSARTATLEGPAAAQLEEVALYRDAKAAKAAMTELRAALDKCHRRDDGSGVGRDAVWTRESVKVGDEAMQVARQGFHGAAPTLHGQRLVVMRKGSAVAVYGHEDEGARLPRPADFTQHMRDAATMSRKF